MNARRDPNNAGFTLLEMLIYVALFAMAINLMVSMLNTGARLTATTTLGLGRMEGVREVLESFTKHTRRAAAVLDRVGAYESTEDRLVLQLPMDVEDEFDYLVLGRLHEPHKFGVLGLKEGDAGLETVYMATLRQPLEVLRFEVDRTGPRVAVHLEVQVKLEDGERDRAFVLHRSAAVPRGIVP